jgi:hypothetical protein
MNDMPKLLYTGPSPHSGHRIDKFIRCPQRWAYDQITPSPLPGRTESPALIKGTLGHIGLAHYYRRLQADQQGEDKSQWWAPIRAIEERAAQEGPSWLQHVTEAQGAVEAYMWHYGAQEVHVLAVEESYALPIEWNGKSWLITRSADLVVEAPDGVVRIVDHKFVGRLNTRTIDRYRLSGQFLDYALIGKAQWGERFGGAYLNFIEWRGSSSKPHRMEQYACPAAPAAVTARQEQLAYVHAMRDKLTHAGLDLWNYPKRLNEQVCNGPYGVCDAAELCAWGKVAAENI